MLKPEQRQHIENLLRHQGIRLPPLAYCNEWYLLEMYAAAVFEGERRQHPVVSGDRLHLTANAHKLAMFGSESSQHMCAGGLDCVLWVGQGQASVIGGASNDRP